MTWSVLVAFRDDSPEKERTRVWEFIRERMESELPDAEICVGTDDGVPFSKTAALNRAAAKATGDVFYLIDADSWVDSASVHQAVAFVEAGEAWCKPWRYKLKLSEAATQDVLALGSEWDGKPVARDRNYLEVPPNAFQPAPPVVLSREAYFRAAGPHWARFKGWGSEDSALWLILRTLYGPPRVLPGECIHLHHPRLGRSGADRWEGQDDTGENRMLHREYIQASRSKNAMQTLLEMT